VLDGVRGRATVLDHGEETGVFLAGENWRLHLALQAISSGMTDGVGRQEYRTELARSPAAVRVWRFE